MCVCVFSQIQFSRGKSLIGQTRSWGTTILVAAAINAACSGNSAVLQRKKPGEERREKKEGKVGVGGEGRFTRKVTCIRMAGSC